MLLKCFNTLSINFNVFEGQKLSRVNILYSCLRGMLVDDHAGILYHSANFHESILISELIIFDTQ